MVVRRGAELADDVKFEPKQVNRKFNGEKQHAKDFGVEGNNNAASQQKWVDAMREHMRGKDTMAIDGWYRQDVPVRHFVDPHTGLNVMTTRSGEFISAWRLGPEQLSNVVTRGKL